MTQQHRWPCLLKALIRLGHIHCRNDSLAWKTHIHAELSHGQDTDDFRQSIAYLGETDKSCERVQTVGKTQDRELKSQKTIPSAVGDSKSNLEANVV